ncbi:MAG: phosphatidylglycerophosphatase A [Alphaproteobacteria bacterium]|nr:phosphatidylglycerophosphatase A [Alphaproteobacteria bacterium]
MKQQLATAIATWFWSGKSPKAPGTVGSLAALPFAWAVQTYAGPLGMILAALLLLLLGAWATGVYMKATGRQDPGEVVIDEVVGIFIILTPFPFTWQAYLLGFALFRVFDVLKPWPIRAIDQRWHSAFGVMADDILAALYPYFLLVAGAVLAAMAGYPLNLEWATGWMLPETSPIILLVQP